MSRFCPTNTHQGDYQADDELGLIYLKARYYAPELGRFITRDQFRGGPRISQSLNRYVYAHNNPVNQIDPSGRGLFGDFLDVGDIVSKVGEVLAKGSKDLDTVFKGSGKLFDGVGLILDSMKVNKAAEEYNQKLFGSDKQQMLDARRRYSEAEVEQILNIGLPLGLGSVLDLTKDRIPAVHQWWEGAIDQYEMEKYGHHLQFGVGAVLGAETEIGQQQFSNASDSWGGPPGLGK